MLSTANMIYRGHLPAHKDQFLEKGDQKMSVEMTIGELQGTEMLACWMGHPISPMMMAGFKGERERL